MSDERKEVEELETCTVERIYNEDGTYSTTVTIKSGVESDKVDASL
jgi:hypothetical protein